MTQAKILKMLSRDGLKRHPAMAPLVICIAGGGLISFGYLYRLATRNPDVSWNKSKNPEPWQDFKTKQYKFYSPNINYAEQKHPSDRPEI